MKKFVDLAAEVIENIKKDKYVEGSLHKDKKTGKIVFRAYVRQSHLRQPDRVICQLENGWLKESPRRIKFYNSVKKALGRRMVEVVMHRDLKSAMDVMKIQEILDNI